MPNSWQLMFFFLTQITQFSFVEKIIRVLYSICSGLFFTRIPQKIG